MNKILGYILISVLCLSCNNKSFDTDRALIYCINQIDSSLKVLKRHDVMPRNILNDTSSKDWACTTIHDWTSGFWPGILWYAYEYSKDKQLLADAEKYSKALYPVLDQKITHHDWGFMMYCSLGNGYRLTGNPEYKQMLLQTADSLAILYNPKVGTINSWPIQCEKMEWPHNTIIDNMLNLELLFWASKNGGGQKFYDMAKSHAEVTMRNQFRDDYSTYHVVVYDTISGSPIKQITHQGYADSSMWARGQGWAIYGFTMCYRETGNKDFLETARKATAIYLKKLPEDKVPYWDFDDPAIPNAPRDASAAALVASALLELSQYVEKGESQYYMDEATEMLQSLSSEQYQSREKNHAFLLHSTGHKPHKSEIDASIIYADYYYIEALIRLKKISEGKNLFDK
ncbi:glycoside hydrolase family 88 protein [Dysgonomonas reticulitermitis]